MPRSKMNSNFVKACIMYSNMIAVKIAMFLAVPFSITVNRKAFEDCFGMNLTITGQ